MEKKGLFYIIAAPSGCGKSSIVSEVIKTTNDVEISISYTTRPKGRGEEDKKHYFFVSEEEFNTLAKNGSFLETAEVYGNHYGTSRELVERFLNQGIDVILDIDWQGARAIKKIMPESISIYILPPSGAELRRRLQARDREDNDVIEKRMEQVAEQLNYCSEFDYLIVNDEFEQAVMDFKTIILANRLTGDAMSSKYQTIVNRILAD